MRKVIAVGEVSWDPQRNWENALRVRSMHNCISLIQIAGWELLTHYLNGGLGMEWWLFPAKLGVSDILVKKAKYLNRMWNIFSRKFGLQNPMKAVPGDTDVEMILCRHYQNIGYFLKGLPEKKSAIVHQKGEVRFSQSQILSKLIGSLNKLRHLLIGYWFHGSIGSGDVKESWSDVDGLAIISKDAFAEPLYLRNLRFGLIRARAFMLDFMPYQMHGHFILAEPDLTSFPTCMFPTVLFEKAKCALATHESINLYERFDKRMALEMLWTHGVSDFLNIPDHGLDDTMKKIAFLHRVFLLPCLVFQTINRPCFKKHAFERLNEIFTADEIEVIMQASQIWSNWRPPTNRAKLTYLLAWPLRFNPLLYQKASHEIGKRIQWISAAPSFNWQLLVDGMRMVAGNVWQRTLHQE